MASRRMQSAASVLGVIAIVSVMIIATASETESGAGDSAERKGGGRVGRNRSGSISGSLKVERRRISRSDEAAVSITGPSAASVEINFNGSANTIVDAYGLEGDRSDVRFSQVAQNDPPGDPVHANGYPVAGRPGSNGHSIRDGAAGLAMGVERGVDSTSRGTPTETTPIAAPEVLTLRETLIENRNQSYERQSAPASPTTGSTTTTTTTTMSTSRATATTTTTTSVKNSPTAELAAMIDREVAVETAAARRQNGRDSSGSAMPDASAAPSVPLAMVAVKDGPNEVPASGTAPTTSIDRKDIADIRAVSFQVPSAALADGDARLGKRRHDDDVDVDEDDEGKRRDDDDEENRREDDVDEDEPDHETIGEGRKPIDETRKDRSRPANNLLVSGKATKAFYEIKPSIKTEMDRGHDQPVTTAHAGRRFVLPSVDSAFGKFGPYFEDGEQEVNMTARIGSTVLLDCKIGMLGDKKVTWVQHVKDSFRLLTVDRTPYSVDQRIGLKFRYPSNWRLQILYATPRDSGLYQCQVATHPPLVKKINVIVTAPALTITDDSGRIVAKERHLKAGSALSLRCEARDVLESQNESVVWTRGDETLTEDVSENRTTEISAGKEVLVIVSTLIVERASPRHAGNYSCVVPGKAKTTIAVHVLNGELPAAVHDGSGVSRAVLNLWLIHLTVSYIFSR